jgi:hypothetical protein
MTESEAKQLAQEGNPLVEYAVLSKGGWAHLPRLGDKAFKDKLDKLMVVVLAKLKEGKNSGTSLGKGGKRGKGGQEEEKERRMKLTPRPRRELPMELRTTRRWGRPLR